MRKKRKVKETRAKYATKRAKIAVEIDPAQLADEAIIIKQNGELIGAVISAEDYRALDAWKEQSDLGQLPAQFLEDRAAFQRMLPELLKTHKGKWVAVYKGQVVDSAENVGDLAVRVYARLGYQEIYMDEVLEEPRVYRILSPRIVR